MTPFTVAVAGKGGTGKTTISALLIDALVREGMIPVLAVDADPNANLNEALGIEVAESLGSMREDAFTRNIPPGMSRNEYIGLRFRKVLVEGRGFDLLVMGRPEGSGCYCFANDLLSSCMRSLERDYRFVVIDTEAGLEHISRGTIGHPDVLLIVSDPGARGVRTVGRIRELALSLGLDGTSMLTVYNRIRGDAPYETAGIPHPAAYIPEDPSITDADLNGRPITGIPADSPARAAADSLAKVVIRRSGQPLK
ncbi:CO dehydrogenase maturation factor [Methanolinea mesophila]|uniref:ATP-binding protein n=1 Tax=Methanolinea mesophila TaxID=547055 RepID=UPI001AE3F56B|nr:AAA family ATPase [Methanolinea mesophila]MBP1928022.1 CO dehydrogenase maturation factor [Methanolinea mesophila]